MRAPTEPPASTTSFDDLSTDLLVEIAGCIPSFVDLVSFLSCSKKLWKLNDLPEITTSCLCARPALLPAQVKRLHAARSAAHMLACTRMLVLAAAQSTEAGVTLFSMQDWDDWALCAVELGRLETADLLYSTMVRRPQCSSRQQPADAAAETDNDAFPALPFGDHPGLLQPGQGLPRRSAGASSSAAASHGVRVARHSADPTRAARKSNPGGATASPKPPVRLTASQAAALKMHAPTLTTTSMASSAVSQADSTFSLAMPSMRVLQRNSRNLPPSTAAGGPTAAAALGPKLCHRSPACSSSAASEAGARVGAVGTSAAAAASRAATPECHPEDECEEGPREQECCLADVHYIGDAALRHACHVGNLAMVRMLLEHGADVHARDGMPLALAAGGGHLDVVRHLVDTAGANVQAGGNKALAAAIASAKLYHLQILKLLLEKGANVHASDDFALRWACLHGRITVARVLIDHGADVHAGVEDALYQAAKNGHQDVVKLLLQRGANPSRCQDAILRAEERGHLEVVALLAAATRKNIVRRVFSMLACGLL